MVEKSRVSRVSPTPEGIFRLFSPPKLHAILGHASVRIILKRGRKSFVTVGSEAEVWAGRKRRDDRAVSLESPGGHLSCAGGRKCHPLHEKKKKLFFQSSDSRF